MSALASMVRGRDDRSVDASVRGPHAVPFLTRSAPAPRVDYPSLAMGPAVTDASDPKVAERIRRARVRLAREDQRLANAGYAATKQDARRERAEEDLRLAESGLKRQFLTGRIVPVKGSRRARAHPRRLR